MEFFLRIMNGQNTFRDLLPILTRKCFSSKTKGRISSACIDNIMIYEKDTWPVKEDDVITL